MPDLRGTVFFVPGLHGGESLAKDHEISGTNEESVRSIAAINGWTFRKAIYQTAGNPNPLLSEMQRNVAHQLSLVCSPDPTHPVLVCGVNVGFGVAIGALARLYYQSSNVALLGYNPIPDPLLSLEMTLGDEDFSMVEAGLLDEINVSRLGENDAEDDFFLLSPDHLTDKFATCVLSKDEDKEIFRYRFNMSSGIKNPVTTSIRQATLIYRMGNPASPLAHMQDFKDAVQSCEVRLVEIPDVDTSDPRLILRDELNAMMARLK